MSRRNVRIAISFVVSAVLLGFALRGVDWAEAGRALAEAHWLTVVPLPVVVWWTLLIRAQRWRLFLRPLGTPAMKTLIAATNIGFMANMVLPLRVGEVVRPVLASRREKLALSGVLATVVLERIFDMFTVLLLFGTAAAFLPVSPELQAWGYRFTVIAVLIAGGVALARWQEQRMLALVRSILRLAPEALREPGESIFGSFVQALEVLDSPLTFVKALGWSLYLWAVILLCNAIVFFTFDLPVPVILGSVAVTAIIALAVSVPSAPGYIGAFQLGCTVSLAIFSISESRAIAYSIVLHLANFIGCISAGLFSLWAQGMTLHDVEAVSEAPDAVP